MINPRGRPRNGPMALTAVALISHDMNGEAPPSCLDIKQVNPCGCSIKRVDLNGEWPRHRPSKAKASARRLNSRSRLRNSTRAEMRTRYCHYSQLQKVSNES